MLWHSTRATLCNPVGSAIELLVVDRDPSWGDCLTRPLSMGGEIVVCPAGTRGGGGALADADDHVELHPTLAAMNHDSTY